MSCTENIFNFSAEGIDVPLGSFLTVQAKQNNDRFTIASLTVEVQEVPTPAAVLPIVSGLFAVASRRKDEESDEV